MLRSYELTTRDADAWRAVLPAETCVMGSLEYARVLEARSGCAARMFVVEARGDTIAYPFLLRPVAPLPFATAVEPGRADTFTPEYTGPLRVGAGPPDGTVPRMFADLFAQRCRELGVVAEFAHLNPWHGSGELLDPACVQDDREVVWIDLTGGRDRLWRESLNGDARRCVRRAERAGVRVVAATSRDQVLEFHRLHALTMQRRRALDRYSVAPDYFLALFEEMPSNARFVLAEYHGRVVAGGLFLHGGTDVYWHLSAADLEFSRVRPVNACVFDAIRWAASEGKQRMLCGGGYAPDDGVFRFKATFSPLRARFRVYRRIHDAAAYAALTRAWAAHHGVAAEGSGFFPAYRAAPPAVPSALPPDEPARSAAAG